MAFEKLGKDCFDLEKMLSAATELTWFKLTEGRYMQIDEGAVFERDEEVSETGSWWQGVI